MLKTYTCAECGCHLIAPRDWRAAPEAQRTWWRENDRRPHGGRGLCQTCYARARYREASEPARAARRARKQARILHMRADGHSLGTIANQVGLPKETVRRITSDPVAQDQMFGLLDGRWVLDPVTRVQRWEPAA